MRVIMQFLDYWWENIKLAKEWRELIAFVSLFFLFFVAFVLRNPHGATTLDDVMGTVERLSIGSAFIIFFAWVPFKRHQNEERIRAKTVETLAEKMRAINEAPAAIKQTIDEEFGNWIMAVQNLRDSIVRIKPFKYDSEIVATKHSEINRLMEQIFDFLASKISRGDAAIFIGTRPEPIRLKDGETVMVQMENDGRKREGHIKYMDALISALETIHRNFMARTLQRHQFS